MRWRPICVRRRCSGELEGGRLVDVDLVPPGPLAPGGLRVTALGGISEIGRNMTVFEHLGPLLIIDFGVLVPPHDEPGVDLILPDLRHIEDRLEDIEALVLTHAHEDHIGAIPFLLKLRPDIPVVGSKFTLALVAEKCREHRIKPVFVEVAENSRTTHGVFECEFFAVNHSVPDALAIAIVTGAGIVLHTGDIKFDQLPLDRRPTDLPCMWRPGDTGGDLGLLDLTNGGGAGALGRRVALVGGWMVRNMGVARELGFLNVADDVVLDIGAAELMPPERVVLITTGTQGEPMSALPRLSR